MPTMIANLAKVCQRRLYDLLTSRVGLIFLLSSCVILSVSLLHFGEVLIQWSTERYHALGPAVSSSDNLKGRSFLNDLCPPLPIDVVYTWVNGSDPRLQADLVRFQRIFYEEERAAKLAAATPRSQRANTSEESRCLWSHCNRWAGMRFSRCSLSTNLNGIDASVLEKTNHIVSFVAPSSANLSSACATSAVFLTPDTRPVHKLLFREALWITGDPFQEKGEGRFLSQLQLIFDHLKEKPSQRIQLLSFTGYCVLVCNPACNHTSVRSTLSTFSSLRLSWRPVYVVWNETMSENITNTGTEDSDEKDRTSRSRYEDNEELRYSLRSVDEFAPWVRRIFLVTNGQVPAWLRLDHPRLRIVTHAEIFANLSHLPTFNSAAIEMHLHRIDGLSRFFIYMNDDVFFGAPVHPEDFYTHARGQRVYLSWAVPNCRPGCPANWLHDGYCDKSCNHPECDFDAGDCGVDGKNPVNTGPHAALANAWAAAVQRAGVNSAPDTVYQPAPYRPFCHGTCADAWLGDGACDVPCDRLECAFDAGDCGDRHFTELCAVQSLNESSVVELPKGVTEVVVDLSILKSNVTWTSGRYRVNSPYAVRSVTLAQKYQVMLVLFHKNLNRTELVLTIQASNNVTRNISMIAHTNFNGTCPAGLRFNPVDAAIPKKSLPTMKPYAQNKREPRTDLKLAALPVDVKVLDLEEKLWSKVNRNPNSSESLFLMKTAKHLEREWMIGVITERGYRYWLWQLLSGSPVRITADRKRVNTRNLPVTSWQKRRLLGTYAQSLIHSNRLFSKTYGHTQRKVPGHMPHFLDVKVLKELETRFRTQWQQTSQHRVRSADDLQYAFSYFYFLMSERVNRTLTQWLSIFDTDRSGKLNTNELRSLGLHLWGLPFDSVKLNATFSNCSIPYSTDEKRLNTVSIESLVNCDLFNNISRPHLINSSRFQFEVAGEEDIWFKMLNANHSRALHHLDEIRSERRKFMCLNDDIDHAGSPVEAAKVRKAMRQLLMLMFPRPSQFELPKGVTHGYRYRDEWLKEKTWHRRMRTVRVLAIVVLLTVCGTILFRRQCWKALLRTFRRLRKSRCFGGRSPSKV